MTTEPTRRTPLCPSELALDRWTADELSTPERERLAHHLRSCARCANALEERAGERAAFRAEPRLLALLGDAPAALQRPPSAAPWWRRAALVATPLAALAALVLLWLRPAPASDPAVGPVIDRRATRKGGEEAVILVQRDGDVWVLEHGSQLHPGDRLQVKVQSSRPRYVALYAKDGAGVVSRYAPTAPEMTLVHPDQGGMLPNSTVLDDVLGQEALALFTCEHAQSDETLRAHVERGELDGCEVARYPLTKVAR